MPISLNVYDGAATITSKYFRHFQMPDFEKIYLPDSVKPFLHVDPTGTKELLIDDNRSAIGKQPYMTIDGVDFYFSVKGIGSTTSPFSRQLFKKEEICGLLKSGTTKDRITNAMEKVMIQETRLIPSNIRIYFHSDWTIGDDTGELFDFCRIDNTDKAMDFLRN